MERSRFYASLGIDNVNIKETIARSLNDPVKIKKLLQTVRIPIAYRIVIYRTMFEVKSNHEEYLMLQDCNQYFKPESKGIEQDMVKMLLVKNWELSPFELIRMELPNHLIFIASNLVKIFQDLAAEDVFWLFNNFIIKSQIPMKHQYRLDDFNAIFQSNLTPVYDYLVKMNVDWTNPIQLWMLSLFSNVLNHEILESLWDIIVSGDKSILLYLGLSCIQNLELVGKSREEIEDMLQKAGSIINHQKVGSEAVLKWRKTL